MTAGSSFSLAQQDDILLGRYRVVRPLGEGTFSEIYLGRDTKHGGAKVALKISKPSCPAGFLKTEGKVLNIVANAGDLTPRCRAHGIHRTRTGHETEVVVLDLLGQPVSDRRLRLKPNPYVPLVEGSLCAVAMLRAVRQVHAAGFVHRDIKASNFLFERLHHNDKSKVARWDRVYLIDFGLAREILLATGDVVPARPAAAFRGTTLYASPNAHAGMDLGRRDDLWSLVYVIIDLVTNALPWKMWVVMRQGSDRADHATRDEVGRLKRYLAQDPSRFPGLENLEGIREAMSYLGTLSYESVPDYDRLEALFRGLPAAAGVGVAAGEYPVGDRSEEMRTAAEAMRGAVASFMSGSSLGNSAPGSLSSASSSSACFPSPRVPATDTDFDDVLLRTPQPDRQALHAVSPATAPSPFFSPPSPVSGRGTFTRLAALSPKALSPASLPLAPLSPTALPHALPSTALPHPEVPQPALSTLAAAAEAAAPAALTVGPQPQPDPQQLPRRVRSSAEAIVAAVRAREIAFGEKAVPPAAFPLAQLPQAALSQAGPAQAGPAQPQQPPGEEQPTQRRMRSSAEAILAAVRAREAAAAATAQTAGRDSVSAGAESDSKPAAPRQAVDLSGVRRMRPARQDGLGTPKRPRVEL